MASLPRNRMIAKCIGYQRELKRLGLPTDNVFFKDLSDDGLTVMVEELGQRVLAAHTPKNESPQPIPAADVKLMKSLKQRQKMLEEGIGRALDLRQVTLRQGGSTRELNRQIKALRHELAGVESHMYDLEHRSRRDVTAL